MSKKLENQRIDSVHSAFARGVLTLVGVAAWIGFTACADKRGVCLTDDDCDDGFACELRSTQDEGVCFEECLTDNECADGFVCDGAGACIEEDSGDACSEQECAPYLCDDTGSCFDECDDGAQCVDGAQCTDGLCESIPERVFEFVAVVSEAAPSSEDVLGTNTPGPDLDAVAYVDAFSGTRYFAGRASSSRAGTTGESGNEANDLTAALGIPDVVPDSPSDECNFASGYWSMGANDGFAIFSLEGVTELAGGSTVIVYEVGTDRCTNAASRADVYSVWTGDDRSATTAQEIRLEWCALGTSSDTGGVFESVIDFSDCL